jgi:adenine-specific DNA-methyltransferase
MSKYDDLVSKLKEIFQIDKPQLDFGVYRILNARADEINDYLENRLKAKVAESLASAGNATVEHVQKELKEKEAQYRADGIDPDTVPKIKELRQKLAEYTVGSAEHENAVFSHLLTFFSRYYDNGDFISQRRYKGDTYAIPYAGEEVMLHWANKDQYYTKSGENFSNYSFKLPEENGKPGRSVHFRLVAADTAKDNRKDNDKERRFVLIEQKTVTRLDEEGEEYDEELQPIAEVNGELVLSFEYKAMPKGSKQDALVTKAIEAIFKNETVKQRWLALMERAPTESNPQRTVLEKCLTDYTAKNTTDYFIHKDLGRFLKGELDFYIKNEVMHLDDVQHAEKFSDIEKNLRMIQCLRSIALDLIAFLAQLEDFQKKLWLKKKFVVAAHYCLTLDRVPASLYPAIAQNPRQWEQWEKLGMLEGKKDDLFKQAKTGTVDYLQAHPYLMVDSALFDEAFKATLLNSIENLDDSIDGLLIHGDNFQAINLLRQKHGGQAKFVYMDPPYNTGKDGFLYKDNYLHSTWLSFISSRIEAARTLLQENGGIFCSLDDNEAANLEGGISSGGTSLSIAASFFVQVRYPNKTLSEDSDYHKTIERVLVLANDAKSFKPIKETVPYSIEKFEWEIVELSPGEEIHAGGKKVEIFKPGTYDIKKVAPNKRGLKETWATGSLARQKGSSGEFLELNLAPRKIIDGLSCLYKVYGIGEDGLGYRYFTGPKREDATKGKFFSGVPLSTLRDIENGGATKDLPIANFCDFAAEFGNCRNEGGVDISGGKKPEKFVAKFLNLASMNSLSDWVVDPFAGSGTTPSVALQLDKKFIAIEVSDYFKTKVIPRMQRAYLGIGTTISNKARSGMFKHFEIESYEDTLNNLELRRTDKQSDLLQTIPKAAQEDYLLRYMLDVESRGSLLSVDSFKKPFDFLLKVAVDSAGASEVRKVDLVETFNYLIGLRVKHIDAQLERGFITVIGTLPGGEKTLVLWRDCEVLDYDELNKLCDKLAINPKDSEFEVVYINGDHNIPAVLTTTEEEGGITRKLKLHQIEPEFLSRMFDVEGV